MSRGPKTIRLANVRIRSQRALENDTMHSFTKCETSLSFSIPSNLHLIRRISYVCYDATPSQLKPFFACMSGVGALISTPTIPTQFSCLNNAEWLLSILFALFCHDYYFLSRDFSSRDRCPTRLSAAKIFYTKETYSPLTWGDVR